MGNSYGTQFTSLLNMIDHDYKLNSDYFKLLLKTLENKGFPLTTWRSNKKWINDSPLSLVEYCLFRGKYQAANILLQSNMFDECEWSASPLQILTKILSQEIYFDYINIGISNFSQMQSDPYHYIHQNDIDDIYLDQIINFFLEKYLASKDTSPPEVLYLEKQYSIWNKRRSTSLIETNWVEMIFYFNLPTCIATLILAAEKKLFMFPENFGKITRKGSRREYSNSNSQILFDLRIKRTEYCTWYSGTLIYHLIHNLRFAILQKILSISSYRLNSKEESYLYNGIASINNIWMHKIQHNTDFQNLVVSRLAVIKTKLEVEKYFQMLSYSQASPEMYSFLTVEYIDSLEPEVQLVVLNNYQLSTSADSADALKYLIDLDFPIAAKHIFQMLEYNRLDLVKYVFDVQDLYATISERDDKGNDFLHIALANKQLEMIEFFLPKFQFNYSNENQDTHFSLACRLSDDKYARIIYQKKMIYHHLKSNRQGKTAAFYLLENNHIDLFQKLLENNNINWSHKTILNNDTIIHFSARFCHDGKDIIQLLEYYAKTHNDTRFILNRKNNTGETPISIIHSRSDLENKKCVLRYFQNLTP